MFVVWLENINQEYQTYLVTINLTASSSSSMFNYNVKIIKNTVPVNYDSIIIIIIVIIIIIIMLIFIMLTIRKLIHCEKYICQFYLLTRNFFSRFERW